MQSIKNIISSARDIFVLFISLCSVVIFAVIPAIFFCVIGYKLYESIVYPPKALTIKYLSKDGYSNNTRLNTPFGDTVIYDNVKKLYILNRFSRQKMESRSLYMVTSMEVMLFH